MNIVKKAALLLVAMSVSQIALSRDYISIVGSSTVYPFATVVAEKFGRSSSFKTPKIESTGSGGGFKLFCQGVGENTPDISNASRRVKKTELQLCAKNGVKDVIEVVIGYDGIVFANSRKAQQLSLSLRDIYLALAKEVPNPKGGKLLVTNPYKTWKDVNSSLPAIKIEVLGPPPTSGTRDAFVELAMEGGCKTFPFIKAMKKTNKKNYKNICHSMREDGAFIEAGENDNLIVQKLHSNPKAFGIFGFSFLDENADKVQGTLIESAEPSFENIADGKYPISRPLFFYVKKAHIGQIPGIEAYLNEFTSNKAWGDEGYLADKGLIPLPEAKRKEIKHNIVEKRSVKL